jgi:hexokinase
MALKNIDINCLIEVFDILNDTIAVLIANGAIEPFVKDSLNFA